VAFSPDGRRFVTAIENDRAAKVRDADTGQEVAAFTGHDAQVGGVAFHPGGRLIVSCAADKDGVKDSVKVWEAATGKPVLDLTGFGHTPVGVAFSPDGRRIAACALDRSITLWDAESGRQLSTWKVREDSMYLLRIRFSPDGKWLLTNEPHPSIYRADDGLPVWTLNSPAKARCTQEGPWFSPDGRHVYTDGGYVPAFTSIDVWDCSRGLEYTILEGDAERDKALKWSSGTRWEDTARSPDGTLLVSVQPARPPLWEGACLVRDAADGRVLLDLQSIRKNVLTAVFSPDGKRLVTGGSDKTIKVWDAENGHELLTLKGHAGWVTSLAVSADGKRIVSASSFGGSGDETIRV
jgi:WD40 repeat protein